MFPYKTGILAMKRILLCHDGTKLTPSAMSFLHEKLQEVITLDVLYVIPRNLIHYGQVDQLATPTSKQEFIDYVQELGVQECKEKLHNFVLEIEEFAKAQHLQLEIKLHVRWGKAIEAIEEVSKSYSDEAILLPNNIWEIDELLQKNVLKLQKKLPTYIMT